MNNSTHVDNGPMSDAGITAALKAMPEASAPQGAWKGVLERYDGERQRQGPAPALLGRRNGGCRESRGSCGRVAAGRRPVFRRAREPGRQQSRPGRS